MQNRYTADIGDYGKYALLNFLCKDLELGVVWYLVPDESHTNDGKFMRYPHLKYLDSELYSKLLKILKKKRAVKAVEQDEILQKGTTFYNDILSFDGISLKEREGKRSEWMRKALNKTKACDIVFFDPDNGIGPKLTKPYHIKGPKYAYLNEAKGVF